MDTVIIYLQCILPFTADEVKFYLLCVSVLPETAIKNS